MICSCKGIVFQTHKYSESSVVAKIYTSEFGLLSFMINGVRSQKGPIRSSHLQPLNLLELVIYHKQSISLQRVKELKCEPVLHSLHYNMSKAGIVVFIKELLCQCVQEEERNTDLFDFLWSSIQFLDLTRESVAGFPIYFLTQLSRYLGFFPGDDRQEGFLFNLASGTFHHPNEIMSHSLDEEESEMLYRLKIARFDNFHLLKMDATLRKRLLYSLIEYYRRHLIGFKPLHSPGILHEVMKNV